MLVNGKGEIPRKVNVDPYFDNTQLMLGDAGFKVPYTPQNTWKDPNGDRQDYLERTKGLTSMQKVSVLSPRESSYPCPDRHGPGLAPRC